MDELSNTPQTRCNSKAGWAVGTTTTLSQVNAIQYEIVGVSYAKAATTNEATPTTDARTGVAFVSIGPNKACIYSLCRDASGNLKVIQGIPVDLDPSGNSSLASSLNPMPEGMCVTGSVLVKAGSTASAWTFGSSNFSGPPTGVTFSFMDHAGMPPRPRTV